MTQEMEVTQVTVADSLRTLAEARRVAQDRKDAYNNARKPLEDQIAALVLEWETAHQTLADNLVQAETAVIAADQAAREHALAYYGAHLDKHPAEGVTVKLFESMTQTPEIVAYCAQWFPTLLSVDMKRYKDLYKGLMNSDAFKISPFTMPGVVIVEPKPYIDRDLSALLPDEPDAAN